MSLRLAPGQRFHGIPNEIVNVAFLLKNQGQSRNFAISVQESPADQPRDLVFPSATELNDEEFPRAPSALTFLDRISEAKAYVLTNETRPIVISLRVPPTARTGARNVFTLEVQPYLNTASGILAIYVWRPKRNISCK